MTKQTLTEHQCEHEGCTSLHTEEWQYPEYEDDDGNKITQTAWFCTEHAADDGFCIHCGNFWAGVESFDFSPIKGVCENCRVEYEEPDDDDYDDGWDFYDEWEDLVEGETGGRFIGEGSENGAPEE